MGYISDYHTRMRLNRADYRDELQSVQRASLEARITTLEARVAEIEARQGKQEDR